MEQTKITLDAHTIVWAIDDMLNHKLSSRAKQAIMDAEKNGTIYIPTIALLEVLRLIEKGRLSLSFDKLLLGIEKSKHHKIVPFDISLLKVAIPIKDLELHDRLIVATAIMTNSMLVSKDRAILSSGVNVLW